MKKTLLPGVAAVLLWICVLSGSAQDKGYWRAANSTAHAITGDIAMSDFKLSINYTLYTIAQIRQLKPEEATAAFDTAGHPGGSGYLYRLDVPAAKRFLHKNTLCGTDETQWMATYAAGNDLQVAFFSGATMPVFTSEALANSTNLCGLYSYTR
jgi:hypothetical protein